MTEQRFHTEQRSNGVNGGEGRRAPLRGADGGLRPRIRVLENPIRTRIRVRTPPSGGPASQAPASTRSIHVTLPRSALGSARRRGTLKLVSAWKRLDEGGNCSVTAGSTRGPAQQAHRMAESTTNTSRSDRGATRIRDRFPPSAPRSGARRTPPFAPYSTVKPLLREAPLLRR